MIESLSAVHSLPSQYASRRAFYRMLGFEIMHGGDNAAFHELSGGARHLNPSPRRCSGTGLVGTVIFTKRMSRPL